MRPYGAPLRATDPYVARLLQPRERLRHAAAEVEEQAAGVSGTLVQVRPRLAVPRRLLPGAARAAFEGGARRDRGARPLRG